MDDSYKIGWIVGFDMATNVEITPIDERKYDILGRCINKFRYISPEHKMYYDPYKEFEKVFGEKFQLDNKV